MTNRGCPAHAPPRPTAPCWRRYRKCRLMSRPRRKNGSVQHHLNTSSARARGGGTLGVPVQEGHVAAPCCSAIDPESGDRSEVDVASPLLLISHNIHHLNITAHNTTTPPHTTTHQLTTSEHIRTWQWRQREATTYKAQRPSTAATRRADLEKAGDIDRLLALEPDMRLHPHTLSPYGVSVSIYTYVCIKYKCI